MAVLSKENCTRVHDLKFSQDKLFHLLLFLVNILVLLSVMWLTQWLGTLIRAQVFDVNNGNEDKADLVNPANYDLENTQNFYFRFKHFS